MINIDYYLFSLFVTMHSVVIGNDPHQVGVSITWCTYTQFFLFI